MAIFTIGDLHLSLNGEKPMDVFPGWENYLQKIENNWLSMITQEDTVLLAGDTSWAMNLADCHADFSFLQKLPGQKILIKGNHDYWWTTMRKMENFLQENQLDSLRFLHNNCIVVEGYALCGTRGWMFEQGEKQDEKVMLRECGRLEASLQQAGDLEKVVFLHYPPIAAHACSQGIVSLLQQYKVKRCYYGHLHGASIRFAVQGNVDHIEYRLISADSLHFLPYKI